MNMGCVDPQLLPLSQLAPQSLLQLQHLQLGLLQLLAQVALERVLEAPHQRLDV